ncbi:MAG TPA: tetratricopeptide repeat protein [Vicinamibacteria bacterium]|nr:tetratricopeptide repeat protein [Vicinamibacteria bacterium]
MTRNRTAAALMIALAPGSFGQETSESRLPTFDRDVLPLVLEKCASCHRPEGFAPFPLVSYQDVRSRGRQILEAIESGFMPPWLPEPGFGAFARERRLTPEERSMLREWVEGGAPEGDENDRVVSPSLSRTWPLGEPDLVVEMSRSYTLAPGAPGGEDVYRNFVVPVPIETPTFVRALDLHPGNPKIVHHARILVDGSGASRRLDEEDAEPGYDGMLVDGGEFPEGLFLGWSPGKMPIEGEEALVWPLEPSTDLVLQLHLMPSGKPEEIRATVGLYFTDEPPEKRAAVLQLGSRTIDIPAGDPSHPVEDSYVLPADVDVIGIYPHAHFLCHEMQAFATLPDGTRTWLLWIRNWDFYWQDEYRYEAPVALPRGTTIAMRYVYDNSASNPRNPFDPPRRVRWGPRSSDEMGDLLLMVVPRDPGELAGLREDFRRNELRQEVAGYEKRLETDGDDPDIRHELAFAYMELGRAADAIAEWERVVRVRPGFAEAHYNLGGALESQGRRDEAVLSFERAIEANPGYAEAHNNLGVLLQSEGRLKAAVRSYLRALEIRPDYAFAHHNLGSALLARGEVSEAIVHLEKAVDIDPGYAQAHFTLGSALGREGRLEEELAHYQRAVQAKPDYPEALNNMGAVLSALSRPKEAIVPLREAVRLRPDYALAHLNLANALARVDELDEAAIEYRKSISLRPDDGSAHLGLATVLLESGRLSESLSHYRLAVRLRPDDPQALSGLAWILAVHPQDDLREPEKAVRLAERARENLDDAETRDRLAAAYASANRYRDAVEVAEEALVAALDGGTSELAGEIRARLDLYRQRKPYRARER